MTTLRGAGAATHPSAARFAIFGLATALLLASLATRLFQLQVGDVSVAAAPPAARSAELPLPAPRGLLFDREGRRVAVNVASWTVSVHPAELPVTEHNRVLRRIAEVTGARFLTLRDSLARHPASSADPVRLLRGIPREAALLLIEETPRLPGVSVAVEPMRRYLDDTGSASGELLAHVVGYIGPVTEDDLERLAPGAYRHDDLVGKMGVEAAFEDLLRGSDGSMLVERDATGETADVVQTLRPAEPGTNLMLTVDARMQRLATEALAWGVEAAGVRQGATVVMDPQTGAILAMVSLPSYDTNLFAQGIGRGAFEAYVADMDGPLRNHAISDIHPPGSTYKLVTGIAALEEGVTTAAARLPTYACYPVAGAPPGECLNEWNREGFGPLDLVGAFAHSSDTYFYQLAMETGVDALAIWATELGFGQATGVRLPGEASGIVPSSAWAQEHGRSIYTGEVAQVGIGQSMVAVTPLQLLNAYAAVANGGRLMRPMIVRGEADDTGRLVREYEPEVIRRLDVDPAALETMRIAAREVITSGHAYNIRDLELPGALSGKTGTAEFGVRTASGALPFHSWFVAYLPSAPGATDAELAVVTFTHGATAPGNVSTEVVKYFLQLHFGLADDLRLDPHDFSRVAPEAP